MKSNFEFQKQIKAIFYQTFTEVRTKLEIIYFLDVWLTKNKSLLGLTLKKTLIKAIEAYKGH